MKWLILRAGEERGPFALEDMQQLLAIGSLQETDAARAEGTAEWLTVAQALARNSPAVATRKLHLQHEADLRSVSLLYYLGFAGSCCGLLGLVGTVFARNSLALAPAGDERSPFVVLASAVGLAVGGAFSLWMGYNLRRLRRPVILPATVLAIVGLFGFPFGTLINGYVLYLLHSAKGKTVFSDEYQAVIAATPDIACRTSRLAWSVAGAVAVFVLLAVGWAIFTFWRAG